MKYTYEIYKSAKHKISVYILANTKYIIQCNPDTVKNSVLIHKQTFDKMILTQRGLIAALLETTAA